MRVKLKNVFIVYFVVSLVGLLCALLQLGQPCDCSQQLQAERRRGRDRDRLLAELRGGGARGEPRAQGGGRALPTIYVVTPTYARPVQKAELVRLSQTLLHVRALHWVVVEDAAAPTALVGGLLASSGVPFTHLNVETPPERRRRPGDPPGYAPAASSSATGRCSGCGRRGRPARAAWSTSPTTTTPTACASSRRCAAPVAWPSGRWGWWGACVSSGRWWRGAGWWASTPPGSRSAPSRWTWPASPWGCPCCWRGPPPASTPRPRGATWRAACWGGSSPPPSWSPRPDNCTQVLVWHTRTEKPKLRQEEQLQREGRGSDPHIEV